MADHRIWRPLTTADNQIRLLTVQPSTEQDAVLTCSLSIISLDDDPKFAALSYTWGDPAVTTRIILNGQSWPVTVNLDQALKHLRQPSESLVIYADAVCINQGDLDEKSTQVLLMSRIYSQAAIVHCWLGPMVDNMKQVQEMFMQVGRGVMLQNMGPDLVTTCNIRSLIEFLKKPYWKRAWIVQEVVLAQKAFFHCGNVLFSREDLPAGGRLSASLSNIPRNHPALEGTKMKVDLVESRRLNVEGFLVAITLGKQYLADGLLGTMVLNLTRQAATVKHDHVYAILALLAPELRAKIRPDYRATVAQVYSNFAFEFMRYKERAASLLEAAIASDHNPLGLPSWTPDFSKLEDAAWKPGATHFLANSVPTHLTLLEGKILGINAQSLDNIAATHPLTKEDGELVMLLDEPERSVPLHREWRQFLGLGDKDCSDQGYLAGGSLEEAYWRMMCRESIGLNQEESTWITPSEVKTMTQWYQHSRFHDPLENIDAKTRRCITAFSDELALFKRRIDSAKGPVSSSYHIFKTTKGYIGMTDREHTPRVGDPIFLMACSAAPTLLRPDEPLPSGEPTYKLVSQAYITGLMIKMVLDRQVTPETPVIDYKNTMHPHYKVGMSWNRIWLR